MGATVKFFRASPFLMHFYLLTFTHTDKALYINDVILQHYWWSEWTDAVLAGQRLWKIWCAGIVSYSFLSLTPNCWPNYSPGLAEISLQRRSSSRGTITRYFIYLYLSKRTRSDADLCCKGSYWGRELSVCVTWKRYSWHGHLAGTKKIQTLALPSSSKLQM